MSLIFDCVPQVAASPRHRRVEAAQPLQAPQRLVVVKVAIQAATFKASLYLSELELLARCRACLTSVSEIDLLLT